MSIKNMYNKKLQMRQLKVNVDFDTTMAFMPQSFYSIAPSPISRSRSSLSAISLKTRLYFGGAPKSRFLFGKTMEKSSIVLEKEKNRHSCRRNTRNHMMMKISLITT